MDVTCERCATDYEFDDALVSERGTTVECTNCGHKFKVYPPHRGTGAAERWLVHLATGQQLVYTSLRHLQKAIARGQVGPNDQLARENQPARPLGSIAELEPFFRSRRRAERSRAPRTLSGVAPPPNAAMQPARGSGELTGVGPVPTHRTRPGRSMAARTLAGVAPPPNVGAEVADGTAAGPMEPIETQRRRHGRVGGARTLAGIAPPAQLPPSGAGAESAAGATGGSTGDAEPVQVTPQRVLVSRPSESARRAAKQDPLESSVVPAPTIRHAPAPAPGPPQPPLGASSPEGARPAAEPAAAAPPQQPPQPAVQAPEPAASGPSPSMRPRAPELSLTMPLGSEPGVRDPQVARSTKAAPGSPADLPRTSAEPTAESPGLPAFDQSVSQASERRAAEEHAARRRLRDQKMVFDSEPPPVPRQPQHAKPEPGLDQTLRIAPDIVPEATAPPVIHEEPSVPYHSPVPPEAAESYAESLTDPDPRYVVASSARRARSRWIVAVVLLGALLLFGGTVGRQYLLRFAVPEPPQPPPEADTRVAALLEQASGLLQDGDLEGASEQLAKASVLAEADPAVHAATARLETVRADFVWLELRLLDPADGARVRATHRRLGARVGRAGKAVQAALAAVPEEPSVMRARVDWLRLQGKLAEARRLVGPLSKQSANPENAYVLAALDLAETSPAWSTLTDRLRSATAAEGKLGRARAMLVYALARQGSLGQAREELKKLEGTEALHPLVGPLHSFIERFEGAATASEEAGADVATVDPEALGSLDTTVPVESVSPAPKFQSQLTAAGRALRTGDLDRAEHLYRAVLAKQPKNTEALAGLADVTRMRNDADASSRLYDQVLEQNPNYVPALVARADQKWEAGDRAGAIALYQKVLQQVSADSPYGRRAAARVTQGAPPQRRAAARPASPAKPASSDWPPPAVAPQPTRVPQRPHIDNILPEPRR